MSIVPAMVLLVALSAAPQATDNQPPAGFVALFNGRDLAGWRVPEGDNGHWRVVDDAIDYDAESEAKGEKHLWSDREFADYVLRVDWRIKEAPYLDPKIMYILPNGTQARDIHGTPHRFTLPNADSGVLLRGSDKYQVNILCWPMGSGEMYGVRTDPKASPELRAAATPRTQADRPVGEWNTFEITVRGHTVNVVLNGVTVIPGADIPDLPPSGRIGLQHHGLKKNGQWAQAPSLLQFRNICIKELSKWPSKRTGEGRDRAHMSTVREGAWHEVCEAVVVSSERSRVPQVARHGRP